MLTHTLLFPEAGLYTNGPFQTDRSLALTCFLDVRSQRWKKVEVQSKRSYAESARRSRYQDELDIGAGTREKKGAGRQVQDEARGAGQDGAGDQVQVQDDASGRMEKEARSRRGPGRTSRPG